MDLRDPFEVAVSKNRSYTSHGDAAAVFLPGLKQVLAAVFRRVEQLTLGRCMPIEGPINATRGPPNRCIQATYRIRPPTST